MKPLIKKIQRTGVNGTFTGQVEVWFGHRVEPNPVEIREVHIVKGQAEALTYLSPEFYFKEEAIHHARKIESMITLALEKMASEPKREKEPVEQNLKTLGYE